VAFAWTGHGEPSSTLSKAIGTPCHRSDCSHLSFSGHDLALAGSFLSCPPTTHNPLSSFYFVISFTFPSLLLYHVYYIFHLSSSFPFNFLILSLYF
jgi:hypothetical protein